MENNSEILLDENDIEVLVNYDYIDSLGAELKSVEVIICGRGIDILPQMTDYQKLAIITKLKYEIRNTTTVTDRELLKQEVQY